MWRCKECGGTKIILDSVQGTAFGYRKNLDENGEGAFVADYFDEMGSGKYTCEGCGNKSYQIEDIAEWVDKKCGHDDDIIHENPLDSFNPRYFQWLIIHGYKDDLKTREAFEIKSGEKAVTEV